MNELHRQAYLDAIGVDSYFPRAVLPGALPSPQCLIEIKAPELTADAIAEQQNAAASAKTSSAVKDVMASMGFSQDTNQKPVPAKKVEQPTAQPTANVPEADSKTVPEFSLQLLVGERFCLLAKAVPDSQAQPYHQMLVNILFALGEQSQTQIFPFSWPMINSSAVDQSLPIATEALDTYVNDKVEKKTLIILGDAVKYLSLAEKGAAKLHAAAGYNYLITGCAVEAFTKPALKRGIWDDLLAVRQTN